MDYQNQNIDIKITKIANFEYLGCYYNYKTIISDPKYFCQSWSSQNLKIQDGRTWSKACKNGTREYNGRIGKKCLFIHM